MVSIDLTGKVALITGASRGLGAEIAARLHAAGAQVVVNYVEIAGLTNREQAEAICAQLGARAVAIGADVTDREQVAAMIARINAELGGLDIVVNNAAILRDKTLKKMTHDDWDAVIDVNLTGVFNVCKAAAETLREEGRIINLASIAGVLGFFGQANYSAAKAGVIGLTRVLSRELAKRKITVNSVAPGVVLTEMGRSIPEEARAKMLESIPLGRFGEPVEIANAILFLASPLASYVTGQTLHVNGGWHG